MTSPDFQVWNINIDRRNMKKILIVDDETHLLQTLSRAFSTEGVEVITATKMEDAEYAIKNTFFHLMLADIKLTGVLGREGLALLEYVKDKSPGTQVIIMTGYGTEEIKQEAYDKGAYFYFEKPIDLKVLNVHLEKLGINCRFAGK